jgi:hypothetical protein
MKTFAQAPSQIKIAIIISLIFLLSYLPEISLWAQDKMDSEPYRTLANGKIDKKNLDLALTKLSVPADDPPHFWSKIANDPKFPDFHRRSAVFELFRRNIRAGTLLSETTRLLDKPTWLTESDIMEVDMLQGKIPVDIVPNDTIFSIAVIPEKGDDVSAIYLRLQGDISYKDFVSLMLGQGGTNLDNVPIEQIAFDEH